MAVILNTKDIPSEIHFINGQPVTLKLIGRQPDFIKMLILAQVMDPGFHETLELAVKAYHDKKLVSQVRESMAKAGNVQDMSREFVDKLTKDLEENE